MPEPASLPLKYASIIGPPAAFLDRMHRELERHPARIANAVLDAIDQRQMDAIAGREVAARLGNADYGPSGWKLSARDAVIVIALSR